MSPSSERPRLMRALAGGPRRASALLATGLLLTGCGVAVATGHPGHEAQGGTDGTPVSRRADEPAGRSETRSGLPAGGSRADAAPVGTRALPGVGPQMSARIPASAQQAVLVTGANRDTNTATFRLYERSGKGGWVPATGAWPAHNALHGWSTHHVLDDLRSPIGVFGLTDAGGKLANPGTRLPYDHTKAFTASGRGVDGESLAGAFDYVVAINYNRDPGTSPLNDDKPLGAERGGGIWIHVDHGGPTQGCVSVSKDHMAQLLRMLDPSRHPVIVMGDAASLAR